MVTLAERIALRHRLRLAVEAVAGAEQKLSDDDGTAALLDAETAMELAARDLVNAVDDLPPGARPKDWELTPDGRTA